MNEGNETNDALQNHKIYLFFKGLGFADCTLFVAVSAGFLRAIGSAMAGVIVVFKGRRFTLLFSCIGAILAIEIATG